MRAIEKPRLPPLPTRQEIADFCNADSSRVRPVTVRMIRRWEEQGWIKPHPAFQWPRRYTASQVLRFLEGEGFYRIK